MEQEEEREERLRFRSMDEWHMDIDMALNILLLVLIRMMIIAAAVGGGFKEAKLGQPP